MKKESQSASSKGNTTAKFVCNPLGQAALTVSKLSVPQEEILEVLGGVAGEIVKHNHAIKQGDLTNIEQLLYSQSVALDAAFHKFLSMAAAGTTQQVLMAERFEVITGLAATAPKAQEQSRKTLVALAELKSPKRSTTFIKNYVDKQLNHLTVDESPTQPQLEENTHAALDFGSERKATTADTEVAAVAEVIGSTHGGGKSNKRQTQHQARAKEY